MCIVPCTLCNVHCNASQRAIEDTVSSSSEFLESLSNEQHVLGCSADVQVPAQVLARAHCSTRGWLRRQRAGRHQRGGTGSPPGPWHHQQPAPTLPYRARLSPSSTYYLVASPRTVCTALHLPLVQPRARTVRTEWWTLVCTLDSMVACTVASTSLYTVVCTFECTVV